VPGSEDYCLRLRNDNQCATLGHPLLLVTVTINLLETGASIVNQNEDWELDEGSWLMMDKVLYWPR
jgi:hypothetical protein